VNGGQAMRIIDADAVVNIINSLLATDEDGADRTVVSLVRFGLNEAKKTVEDAPTIDPEELRQKGEWTVTKEYNDILDMEVVKYTCSACKEYRLSATGLSQATNYCPNCGAKMRGADG
jgi:hypothetical protein